jgi:putative ABC transport system substrate-binding protein
MRRREFITFLSSAAAAWPFAAQAQQQAPVIGLLNAASAQTLPEALSAFFKGLAEAGFVEGQNVRIEYRWAEGDADRLPTMAADLVRRQVAVIAAGGTPASLAAKAATATIPIVFETAADPVKIGLVASLNRPAGNVTGVTQLTSGLVAKQLELLHELLPTTRVMALLINPNDPALAEPVSKEALVAAHTLGVELHVLNARTERDFDSVFARLAQLQGGGLVIGTEVLFTTHSEQLAALTVRHAVPTVYKGREFAAAGGLLSYGSELTESYRLAGIQAGRILKGDKPADLPVQQATKFEMYINLKTAKALGITVPLPLSGRANGVFE